MWQPKILKHPKRGAGVASLLPFPDWLTELSVCSCLTRPGNQSGRSPHQNQSSRRRVWFARLIQSALDILALGFSQNSVKKVEEAEAQDPDGESTHTQSLLRHDAPNSDLSGYYAAIEMNESAHTASANVSAERRPPEYSRRPSGKVRSPAIFSGGGSESESISHIAKAQHRN